MEYIKIIVISIISFLIVVSSLLYIKYIPQTAIQYYLKYRIYYTVTAYTENKVVCCKYSVYNKDNTYYLVYGNRGDFGMKKGIMSNYPIKIEAFTIVK